MLPFPPYPILLITLNAMQVASSARILSPHLRLFLNGPSLKGLHRLGGKRQLRTNIALQKSTSLQGQHTFSKKTLFDCIAALTRSKAGWGGGGGGNTF